MGKGEILINCLCDGQKKKWIFGHIMTTLQCTREDEIVLLLVEILKYLHSNCFITTWAVYY